jgi:hypothetical protein
MDDNNTTALSLEAPLTLLQLIKQLSATPTIPAQRTAEEIAQDGTLDPQAALRANKEVFFFRLVSSRQFQ